MLPTVLSGKLSAGADFRCGERVVIDVAEEVVIGDRCVLADGTYLGGRRVEIGDDFYGYNWDGRRLDVGRGRRDEERAVLAVGKRCTFHDTRIDLAREVGVGDDVGLSPEVVIYTHSYWLSTLDGWPVRYAAVILRPKTLVGFRSVILPGAIVGGGIAVGAQSVVSGKLMTPGTYAGNPARFLHPITPPPAGKQVELFRELVEEYGDTLRYRGLRAVIRVAETPDAGPECRLRVAVNGCALNPFTLRAEGEEDEMTDDFRDFMFKRGVRFYTRRPFRAAGVRR
jgi:acetyltransferase-like isoleucine patch superfamily enzyme